MPSTDASSNPPAPPSSLAILSRRSARPPSAPSPPLCSAGDWLVQCFIAPCTVSMSRSLFSRCCSSRQSARRASVLALSTLLPGASLGQVFRNGHLHSGGPTYWTEEDGQRSMQLTRPSCMCIHIPCGTTRLRRPRSPQRNGPRHPCLPSSSALACRHHHHSPCSTGVQARASTPHARQPGHPSLFIVPP